MAVDLTEHIRDVPDFPKPGIVFKDIMPLLADADALKETVEQLTAWAEPLRPDLVLAVEARGYITGGALAYRLGWRAAGSWYAPGGGARAGVSSSASARRCSTRATWTDSSSSPRAPRRRPTGASRASRTRRGRTRSSCAGRAACAPSG